MTSNCCNGDIRIGFYICHCGHNIGAVVDCPAVAQAVAKLPGVVVSRDYKYMCSDPGQELIQQDIREHHLTRVVVASCSPLLHEHTFRHAVAAGGLNPFHFQMVNIREHDSWVHTDRAAATAKAKALARAAIERVRFHRPLETTRVPINPDVLVVGGGISGIHAALTLGNANKHVYLVEREPSIGGHMAKFDKTFPTLDCAACILTPKMSAVRAHENITLWTYSEIVKVEGYVGNYTVTVRRKPRYIDEELCVGCQECIKTCIFKDGKFPDEFNVGLSKRKPIYIPFPQAVPQVVVIDPERCLQLKTGKCKMTCLDACTDRKAINFEQMERLETIKVGNIIVATGFKLFDAKRIPQYGYGAYPNVVTSLELERLVTSSGPTGGEILLKNGQPPKSVAFILCVGSRDFRTNRWCSRTCCMHSMKLAQLVREHTDADVTVFYMDIRAPGKGCEEFYDKSLRDGIQFVRGRVAEVTDWALVPEEEGKLVIRAEDTLAGLVRRIPVDMIVLAVGMEPQSDAQEVRRLFNMSCGTEGWFLEKHPKLAPVSTFTDGVFIAGCCQGPKDIPDSIAQAGAAAAEALALIDRGYIEQEPNTAYIAAEECSGCKSCIGLCPYTAITFDETKQVASINAALCKGCGTCVAACPSGSIHQNLFEDQQVFSEIAGVLAD
ncbi:CoB--CoM heterodisulfide reductase iron-sulfur subunit A family protein [Opitutus terrae]|uniref:4Fe-4S ferredoxin iron-sulfur binding domain protein n=1 Tax=Opitutus terrae (strain DSM 11246 / JCM 15787 / PB90-1) TaxID=452637 RepID=B1ZXF9_OPITP|nr:CoB--CoM heterodisulfide reductase iron-sulfur subunit A family protein [Opitutus terrae]ACB76954.1 4Fe-4S ferredoxin iron-sulfur binding domain protein [Opitutus terrae PB90-1]